MFVELMQALFSVMPETAQQPMTDFRRLCLEAEESKELDAAPNNMDDGQQPGDPYAGEIKRLGTEYGPLIEGQHLTVQLQDLLALVPRARRRILLKDNTSRFNYKICWDCSPGQEGESMPITVWSRNWPTEV